MSSLARRLADRCQPVLRLEGDPLSPGETLRAGAGACRDLAVLFIDCCRAVGLPARFVSGYWKGRDAGARRDLHAWAEVFLAGAGWRGFDPLAGLAVADTHIPVAACADPRGAAPIEGALHGADASSRMEVTLTIETLNPKPEAELLAQPRASEG